MIYKPLLIILFILAYLIVIGYSLHNINKYYRYKKRHFKDKESYYKLVRCNNIKCPHNRPYGTYNVCLSKLPIIIRNNSTYLGGFKCICENIKSK